jgi:hypothetical protein
LTYTPSSTSALHNRPVSNSSSTQSGQSA